MSKKVADVLWEILAKAGVKRCYGIVADALNPEDLTFNRGPRLITGKAPTDFDFSKERSEIKREAVNAPS